MAQTQCLRLHMPVGVHSPTRWSIITEFSPSCVHPSFWACFFRCLRLPRQALPKNARASISVPRFKDVAKEAGLTVSHISTPEKKYIVESMSGGAGLIDCDNDGKLDIITVNGSTIDRYRQGGDPMITLYHQDADFKFTDITSTPDSLAKAGAWASRSPTTTTTACRTFTSPDSAATRFIATWAIANLKM